jgi:hypothetical protein
MHWVLKPGICANVDFNASGRVETARKYQQIICRKHMLDGGVAAEKKSMHHYVKIVAETALAIELDDFKVAMSSELFSNLGDGEKVKKEATLLALMGRKKGGMVKR